MLISLFLMALVAVPALAQEAAAPAMGVTVEDLLATDCQTRLEPGFNRVVFSGLCTLTLVAHVDAAFHDPVKWWAGDILLGVGDTFTYTPVFATDTTLDIVATALEQMGPYDGKILTSPVYRLKVKETPVMTPAVTGNWVVDTLDAWVPDWRDRGQDIVLETIKWGLIAVAAYIVGDYIVF